MPTIGDVTRAAVEQGDIGPDIELYARYLVRARQLPVSRGRAFAELGPESVALLLLAYMATEHASMAATSGLRLALMRENGEHDGETLQDVITRYLDPDESVGGAELEAFAEGELVIERRRERAIVRREDQPDRLFWKTSDRPWHWKPGAGYELQARLAGGRLLSIGHALFGRPGR